MKFLFFLEIHISIDDSQFYLLFVVLFIIRSLYRCSIYTTEAEFGEDDEDVVADAGNNADLYAANQASTELINEVPTEEAPLRFMDQDQDVFHHQPLSLD